MITAFVVTVAVLGWLGLACFIILGWFSASQRVDLWEDLDEDVPDPTGPLDKGS